MQYVTQTATLKCHFKLIETENVLFFISPELYDYLQHLKKFFFLFLIVASSFLCIALWEIIVHGQHTEKSTILSMHAVSFDYIYSIFEYQHITYSKSA